jgi:hypothetical protein
MIPPISDALLLLAQVLAGAWALRFAATLLLAPWSRRPDGDRVPIPVYRRLMLHIMRTKTESTVYFDAWVKAEALLPYVAEARQRCGANLTHAVVAATGLCLQQHPRLNRFTSGQRLYQRRGRHVSFSMKRAVGEDGKVTRGSELATVKIEHRDQEPFAALCARINGDIRLQRSGQRTATDKEYALFDLLPDLALRPAAALIRWLDDHNLLPAFFIEGDALFASAFVANLGSLGMDPGYHHLFEYGNTPIFVMVGQLKDEVVIEDGQPRVAPRLHLRFTFDERIDDGLNARHAMDTLVAALEDPVRWLGPLPPPGA